VPTAFNYNSLATVHTSTCVFPVRGCTRRTAVNFWSAANVDDGSCADAHVGCMDPTADNFDSDANVVGDCTYVARGCTDSAALNYNPLSQVDDGSCIPIRRGCNINFADNYDSTTTVYDGSCTFVVRGCTNSMALNYDSRAERDDGGCIFVRGCTDSNALNYLPVALVDDGSCRRAGCMHSRANNFDPSANVDDGSCILPVFGCTHSQAPNYFSKAEADDGSCVVLGCTDPTSPSYSPAATVNDGSCAPGLVGCGDSRAANYLAAAAVFDSSLCRFGGCLDSLARNFNPSVSFDDGSCEPYLLGCTDSRALNFIPSGQGHSAPCLFAGCTSADAANFNPSATVEDGSCHLPRRGCTRSTADNFMSAATQDDGSCIIQGCTVSTSLNFVPEANFDDGSCDPLPAGCRDSVAENYDSGAVRDDGSCIRLGCTDSMSAAYSSLALYDDGSCGPTIEGCDDSRADNYSPHARRSRAGPCAIRGCTAVDALNFDPIATVDDNSCVRRRFGCMHSAARNYVPSATDDDGTCYLLGCTDEHSPTFNPAATASDGSCVAVRGCTDSRAANYHPKASVDDGSCIVVGCTEATAINFDSLAAVDSGLCEQLPAGLGALVWPSSTPSAPLVLSDGSIRRFSFASSFDGEKINLQLAGPVGTTTLMVVGDESDRDSSGVVYLLHMSAGRLSLVRRVPALAGSSISLRAFDWFGCSVLSVGDLNEDGIPELVVGARGDDAGASDGGAIYVVSLDAQANVRSHRKFAHPVAGGLFGSALCVQRGHDGSGSHGESSTIFVGAPGEDSHRGALYMVLLDRDGSMRTAVKIAPSTWGTSGPELVPHARFGASIAVQSQSSGATHELCVGAPGLHGGAGAVFVFDMSRRGVRAHSQLMPPEQLSTSGFGSFLMHGVDLDGDGMREMVAGGPGSLFTVVTGGHRMSGRRWTRIQEGAIRSASKHLAPPPVGARPIAVLGNQSNPSEVPLFWLSRERPRTWAAPPPAPPATRAQTMPRHDDSGGEALACGRFCSTMVLAVASLLAMASAVLWRTCNPRRPSVQTCDGGNPYVLSS